MNNVVDSQTNDKGEVQGFQYTQLPTNDFDDAKDGTCYEWYGQRGQDANYNVCCCDDENNEGREQAN